MYNSTKNYVKFSIEKLMDQCGISIDDIQIAVDEMKSDEIREELINKMLEYANEIENLHTHTSI